MKSKADAIREAMKNDSRPVAVDIYCVVYNHGKYLREALEGMLMQVTDFPFRIIIHDDASTDNSVAIINEYKNKYPDKIVAVLETENMYQNGKSIMLKMLPYLKSKYTAICEGDDYWIDSNKLQKQVNYMEQNPDCSACFHNILPVDENGQYDENLRAMYITLSEGDYSPKELRSFKIKTQTASLMRRNFFPFLSEEDIEVYKSTKANGDEKNLILCGAIGRIHYLSDVMAAHRRVLVGDSYTARRNKVSDFDKLISHGMRYMEKCRLFEYFTGEHVYPYNYILDKRIHYLYHVHFKICKEEYDKMRYSIRVPFYSYIVFMFYCSKNLLKRIQKKIKAN